VSDPALQAGLSHEGPSALELRVVRFPTGEIGARREVRCCSFRSFFAFHARDDCLSVLVRLGAKAQRFLPHLDFAAVRTMTAISRAVINFARRKESATLVTVATYCPWFFQVPPRAGPAQGTSCSMLQP
jgi:hypothetical protein